ncbi:monooxygenase [Aspergillus crustosus]
MSLKILIVGSGVCGPTLATLLQRSNPSHHITVLERSPTLRLAGQQVDLKTQAPHILGKMGLMDEVRKNCVNESGVEMVDGDGKQVALFSAARAGEKRPGLTSEFEILRGDLVRVLFENSVRQDAEVRARPGRVSLGGVEYEFGKSIKALDQSVQDEVEVTFSTGEKRRFDLVVGADGQGSRTRQLAFGKEVSDAAFHSIGVHGAYFSIPRIEGEGSLARGHLAPGRRMVFTRTSDRQVTGVLMFTMQESERVKASYNEPVEAQKEAFAEIFQDVKWQKERLLAGLRDCDDWYAHELGQIKMERLSTGRVVLLGDAGYCPTPFTGLGTNLCLVGAYILAGELARHGTGTGTGNVEGALKAYEDKMRPFIDECQQLSSATGFFFPASRAAVWGMQQLMWVVSKVNGFFPQGTTEDSHDARLPVYPELNLKD